VISIDGSYDNRLLLPTGTQYLHAMDVVSEAAFVPTSSSPSTPRPSTPSVPPPLGASDAGRASSSTLRPPSQEEGKANEDDRGDASDAAGGSQSTNDAAPNQPTTGSLEQEVGQVVSQLSTWGTSIWGGLRKQSAVAFETVKKDMSRTVAEVQDEFHKLQTQTVEVEVKEKPLGEDKVDKGKGKAEGEGAGAPPVASSVKSGLQSLASSTSTQDFLSRLQTTIQSATQSSNIHLPENLSNLHLSQNLASFQKSVTETISSAAHNPNLDVTQIRSSLVQNIQKNLQGVNLKQAEKLAEEYLKKSEGLLAEAGEFLKDAVKVVPPEEASAGSGIGMAWDGSDMYSFSTSTDNKLAADEVIFDQSSSFLGGTRGTSSDVVRAQRKDALMRRLRSDKELLLVDPAAQSESPARRETYEAFVEHEIEGRGGVEGDEFTKMIWEELGPEAKDAEVLKATRDALVPSRLTHELFWTRYFFHKHQIELEEEKRKKLLAATTQPHRDDEDFNWDDNEEETTPKMAASEQSAAPSAKLHPSSVETDSAKATPRLGTNSSGSFDTPESRPPAASAVAARAIGSSASTSPRVSEESYDIVSDQAEVTGSRVRPSAASASAAKAEEGDDSDSDWE